MYAFYSYIFVMNYKDWKQKEKRQQRMRWLERITDSMDMSLSKLQKTVKEREACVLQSMGLDMT